MKRVICFFSLPLLLFACRPEDRAITQSMPLAGNWQISETVGTFYKDQHVTEKQVQKGPSNETYSFNPDGTFELHQGDDSFFINGNWHHNPQNNQLTLRTASGETLRWTVQEISPTRLVLSHKQEITFNGHQESLEVLTTCVR